MTGTAAEVPPPIISNGGAMTVEYTRDYNTGTGFQLTYTAGLNLLMFVCLFLFVIMGC